MFKFLFAFGIVVAALIIHGCRKDHTINVPKLDEATEQAKSWYEATYPASTGSSGNLVTQSTDDEFNSNQHIKPDWQHSKKYKRGNKDVIELPVDPSTKFNSTLRDRATNRIPYDKNNSRSYFLLFNDGKKYSAYIMTVIADASYLKGDTSKLKNNTFNHNDPDFTGLVLYFTPKGKYVQGYGYKNGQLLAPSTSNHNTKQTQSVSDSNLKPQTQIVVCIDWYLQRWENGVLVSEHYVFTTCETYGDEGGDGGSGGTTPPPGCSPPIIEESVSGSHLTVNSTIHVNFIPPPVDPCDENSSHTKDPDFGEDDPSSCLNCRISSDNFDDFLEYNQSIGNSVYYPYPAPFEYNGVKYPGMITEIHTATGIEYYFTPDTNSGLFQAGVQYHVGETYGSTPPSVVYGPVSYFGPTTGSFAPPAGAGSGGRNVNTDPSKIIMIENPAEVDWSNEPDNVTIADPNPVTYVQYQQTTPWPTIANVVPFSQFVPYRKHLVNGVMVGVNCLTLSKEQIAKLGYTCSGYLPNSQTFQTYTSAGVNLARTKQAVTYIISSLTNHIPVIAGIDAFPGSKNFDGITDHFITIDGMGTDSNGKYFHFVDNSTNDPSTGDFYNNRLYYNDSTGKITGKCNTGYTTSAAAVAAGGHDYIVTQIRKSVPKPNNAQ